MAVDNVVVLDCDTRLDIPAERVARGALDADLETILVVGWDKDGRLYKASSTPRAGEILLLLELMKQDLFDQMRETDGG